MVRKINTVEPIVGELEKQIKVLYCFDIREK